MRNLMVVSVAAALASVSHIFRTAVSFAAKRAVGLFSREFSSSLEGDPSLGDRNSKFLSGFLVYFDKTGVEKSVGKISLTMLALLATTLASAADQFCSFTRRTWCSAASAS
jgi:hypothetical protein